MGLTPRSDALNVDGAFEVIAVVGFVVPSPLAVSFARLAACGCGTVALAPDAAWVGNKEGLTMLTFTLWGVTCHCPESPQGYDPYITVQEKEDGADNGSERRSKKTEARDAYHVGGKKKEWPNLHFQPGHWIAISGCR
jgi:hypothetical protein